MLVTRPTEIITRVEREGSHLETRSRMGLWSFISCPGEGGLGSSLSITNVPRALRFLRLPITMAGGNTSQAELN